MQDFWLPYCASVPSPYCDERPADTLLDLLVLHNISLPPGEFGGGYVHQLFCGSLQAQDHPYFAEIAQMRVSAHFLIERDGSATQFVALNQRAWHAGRSVWQGRAECNDYSIGIELEGTDDTAFADAQYHRLKQLILDICRIYPAITADRIVGHSDIAPGRKTDPGEHLDWSRVRQMVCK